MSNDAADHEPPTTFMRSLLREAFSRETRNLFIIVTGFVAVGTLFYMFAEGWSWVDSLYFAVTTLTTVGYGDLSPTTDVSKLFTTFYIFGGLGIVFTFLHTLAKAQAKEPFFYRILNRARNQKKDKA